MLRNLSAKSVAVTLSYLVALGSFLSLSNIANELFLVPLLVMFFLSLINEWKFRVYPPRWILNLSGLVLTFLFLSQLSIENLIEPFASVVILLITVKALEEKRPRDIYQMLLLSLFGVAISATYRLDLSFLLLFIYELFLGTVAFLFTNLYANAGDKPIHRSAITAYLKFALTFPVIVAFCSVPFFLILPRAYSPLFDPFAKNKGGLVSGIANEIELGKVGEIQQDNTVVMRVYGNVPPDPYWRVSVFDTLVGNRWIPTIEEIEEKPVGLKGRTVSYTLLIEPSFDTFLPLLDYPIHIVKTEGFRGTITRRKGGFYKPSEAIVKPIRVHAVSVQSPPRDKPVEVYLQVPRDVPQSIRELARRLSENKSPEERIRAVEKFFSQGFSYTLKLPESEDNPIEHFLFRSKRGNCEFFASSTALLLRLMGIPARIVGGYKGYIKNQYGNYYIVTNSMAHVWVEAYVGGRWLRIDTTPPYTSPSVERISEFDLIRDAIVSFWYENVVDFSAQKQVSFFKGIATGISSLSIQSLKFLLTKYILPLLTLGLLFLSAWVVYSRLRKTPENLYRKAIDRLEKKLGKSLRGKLPEEVIRELEHTELYKEALFIVRLYQRHRFSPHRISRKEIEEAYRVLRKI